MEILDLMKKRHSVRQYLDQKIAEEVRQELDQYTEALNQESGLHIQILYDEPECFSSRMAHYGKFEDANNYIAMVGKKSKDLEECCGFYGEKLVLKAQELGLNTCWTAMSHGKSKAAVGADEKEVIIISLGYGKTQGVRHKGKNASNVCDMTPDDPNWFRRGIEAALLAPTAMNQQKFFFERNGEKVRVKAGKIGPCLKIDLGIVKCHFELGAGTDNFEWV